ncbi:hypothetical protein PsorP6_003573 [Peronosclerospora sorghi]|uniref:Uncharacterized protein n=1 Tax=Peronosclerospora sorghi TaxID=230839 RepID=A0ACC0VMU3_9STRA|nr:hypothetical protein PsorP6_003573 [Peronosclerospora sorghi]
MRLLAKTNPIKFDINEYEKFANKFPYNETEDQLIFSKRLSSSDSDSSTKKNILLPLVLIYNEPSFN